MTKDLSTSEKVRLLSEVPTSDYVKAPPRNRLTSAVEVGDGKAEVTVNLSEDANAEGSALEALQRNGLDPREWEVAGWRSSEWTMPNGELGTSVKYQFRRKAGTGGDMPSVDELLDAIGDWEPSPPPLGPVSGSGEIVAIADTQIGKLESDPEVALNILDKAIRVAASRNPSEIMIAWLGDHVEGFESQGGSNVFRTPLPLTDQIRIIRRIMLHGVQSVVNQYAGPVTVAAVPGNHGDAHRVMGKGATTYTDNHDTEALVQVADVCALAPGLGHVRFIVPDADELTVTTRVAGTVIGMAHGHQWRPGKHMDWWKGQTFGGSPLGDAHILLAGHLHHVHVEASTERFFVQVPSTENESTWWRHRTGEGGSPSALVLTVGDGHLRNIEVVRP